MGKRKIPLLNKNKIKLSEGKISEKQKMKHLLILSILLASIKTFSEPYLYVNTLPSFGMGIVAKKAHYYLGLDWSGSYHNSESYSNDGKMKNYCSEGNFLLAPILGFRYDFTKRNVNSFVDINIGTIYHVLCEETDGCMILIGFGIAVKITEQVEISGEYGIKYHYRSDSEDRNTNRVLNLKQTPLLTFVYYFRRTNQQPTAMQ